MLSLCCSQWMRRPQPLVSLPRYYTANTTTTANFPLVLTDSAKDRLRVLKQKMPSSYLRIIVDAGGCSGFIVKFRLDDKSLTEEDMEVGEDSAKVVLDNISLGFIKGSTIDFENELARQAFVIADNPNATSSCGCNVSFSTD